MAPQSFLLVPSRAGYFHAKFQLLVRHRLGGLIARIREFCPKLSFRKGRKSGHCSPTAHQMTKQRAPNDAGRRETPACKV